MKTELKKLQEMFLVAVASNAGISLKGKGMEEKVYPILLKRMAEILEHGYGDWKVVWGPGIFMPGEDKPYANNVFIAHQAVTNTWFVSVAGTNFHSKYDWVMEDSSVTLTANWPYAAVPGGVQISAGINLGLQHIIDLVGKDHVHGGECGIQEFMRRAMAGAKGNVRVITGGHSLGGALAPVVCLWLADTQQHWNPAKLPVSFECWPFAGFTPGLQNFADYFHRRIPVSVRTWNTLDTVPHGWRTDTLEQVKTLYPILYRPIWLRAAIDNMIKLTAGQPYQFVGKVDEKLVGHIKKEDTHGIIKKIRKAAVLPSYRFFMEMLYQHVNAYFELIKVDWALEWMGDDMKQVEEQIIERLEKEESRFSEPS